MLRPKSNPALHRDRDDRIALRSLAPRALNSKPDPAGSRKRSFYTYAAVGGLCFLLGVWLSVLLLHPVDGRRTSSIFDRGTSILGLPSVTTAERRNSDEPRQLQPILAAASAESEITSSASASDLQTSTEAAVENRNRFHNPAAFRTIPNRLFLRGALRTRSGYYQPIEFVLEPELQRGDSSVRGLIRSIKGEERDYAFEIHGIRRGDTLTLAEGALVWFRGGPEPLGTRTFILRLPVESLRGPILGTWTSPTMSGFLEVSEQPPW